MCSPTLLKGALKALGPLTNDFRRINGCKCDPLLHRRREKRGTKYQIDDTRAREGKRREKEREVDLRFSPAAAVFHLLVYHGKKEKGGRGLLPLLLLPSAAAAEAGLIISRSEASERTKAEEKENERTLPIISPPKKEEGENETSTFFFLEIAKLPLLTREGFLYSSLNDLFPFRAWERRGQQQRKEGEKSPFSARMPLPFPLPPPPPPISHPFG